MVCRTTTPCLTVNGKRKGYSVGAMRMVFYAGGWAVLEEGMLTDPGIKKKASIGCNFVLQCKGCCANLRLQKTLSG